jgi:hypothetical protein
MNVIKARFVLTTLVLPPAVATSGSAQNQQTSENNRVTVPAASKISVRNDQAIDWQNLAEGQTHSATVIQAVEGNAGEVLIPKESPAELVIRQVSIGGTKGTPHLVLDLESVTVDGHRYSVSTGDVTESGKEGIGKNRRTGEMVAGGAACPHQTRNAETQLHPA